MLSWSSSCGRLTAAGVTSCGRCRCAEQQQQQRCCVKLQPSYSSSVAASHLHATQLQSRAMESPARALLLHFFTAVHLVCVAKALLAHLCLIYV
jgi:hypothetical protein